MSYVGLRQDFDRCMTIYNGFIKQSSADDRQSLGIATSSSNGASGNKSVLVALKDQCCDSKKWYTISKIDKDKFLNARSGRNGGKNVS